MKSPMARAALRGIYTAVSKDTAKSSFRPYAVRLGPAYRAEFRYALGDPSDLWCSLARAFCNVDHRRDCGCGRL